MGSIPPISNLIPLSSQQEVYCNSAFPACFNLRRIASLISILLWLLLLWLLWYLDSYLTAEVEIWSQRRILWFKNDLWLKRLDWVVITSSLFLQDVGRPKLYDNTFTTFWTFSLPLFIFPQNFLPLNWREAAIEHPPFRRQSFIECKFLSNVLQLALSMELNLLSISSKENLQSNLFSFCGKWKLLIDGKTGEKQACPKMHWLKLQLAKLIND